MSQEAILFPVFGLAALTLVVQVIMYFQRVNFMKRHRIHPQAVADRASSREALKGGSTSADNYHNLLELPVLFYVLAVLLLAVGRVDALYLGLAWIFVILRVVHSLIHITYNRVMHRFSVFAASSAVLWLMWGRFLVQAL